MPIEVAATFTPNMHSRGIGITQGYGVPCHIIDDRSISAQEYHSQLLAAVQGYEFDLMVLCGYMKILPASFLQAIKVPIINLHPSLLPQHKGLGAIERSFNDNNRYGGVSVHFVSEEVDSGDIIDQRKIDKTKTPTLAAYTKQVKFAEFELLPMAILKVLGVS